MQVYRHLALASVLLLTLSACKAKVTSDTPSTPSPFESPFNNEVQGPSADGKWRSACNADTFQGSHILTLSIQGQNVHWNDIHFSDGACQQATTTDDMDGQFRYTKVVHDDVYEVDFRLHQGNSFTFDTRDMRVANGILWLSSFGSIDPTMALNPIP
jgi:hypothetical protein